MIKIEQKGRGRLIAGKVFLGEKEIDKITLRLEKGNEMRYGNSDTNIVSFPGEYDIDNVSIICVEADKKLSYIIIIDGENIALIQNIAALEVLNFDTIDIWICANDAVKNEIESLEMEGEIHVLGEESNKEYNKLH